MTTLKEFSDALQYYDDNIGKYRYAATWAMSAASYLISGYGSGRAASMDALFAYRDELKKNLLPKSDLQAHHINEIHKIILQYLPKEWGGTGYTYKGSLYFESMENFLNFATQLNHKVLSDLTKLFNFPEYWHMALTALSEEEKKEEKKPSTILFNTNYQQQFEAELSKNQIYNNRVLKSKPAYQNKQNWCSGHCYDVDYPLYHANRIGNHNIILAHSPAPLSNEKNENSVFNFFEQLVFSSDAPIKGIIAIGTPKTDERTQTDVDFYNYLQNGELAGSTAESKITISVKENTEFSKQLKEMSQNLMKYDLTCQMDDVKKGSIKKEIQVLLFKVKRMNGERVRSELLKNVNDFISNMNGTVAVHCHDGVTQSSALLLGLELWKNTNVYFTPHIEMPLIYKWVEDMRKQSTRAFIPTRDLLNVTIRDTLMSLCGSAMNQNSNEQRRPSLRRNSMSGNNTNNDAIWK
jgi:hypothetical protein